MKRFLVIAAFLVLALFIGAGIISSRAPNTPSSSVPEAKVNGSSGSRKTAQLALPTDLPRAVLLPTGALSASNGSSPHWSLGFIANGNYPNVMQTIRDQYTSHGYTETNPTTQPYFFANGTYKVAIVGETRDHSATSTNLTVIVDIK